ncbi:hypothetical protein BDF20DRAFT_135890 [Mycotypha africana]|uniref:uncharacterized protein n=1 Tax=Mycotypha africana TaxID=64632 RepID=UPI0022FFE7BB|nr:uncharacterized protein BDF20DRAFT_135890 [Mycotypha africana]KAI8968955.1 hypothetical protein BDF20DRAFT_135890 [Mycotypha africana]
MVLLEKYNPQEQNMIHILNFKIVIFLIFSLSFFFFFFYSLHCNIIEQTILMTFDFEERQGADLFQTISATDSIIICVNEELKLPAKGITGTLRQKFGNQLLQVQMQKKQVGQVASIIHGQRHIFYMITRQKSYNKTTYSNMERCLIELRRLCEKEGVYSLVLPRQLGGGLDGLQEKYIKDTIFTVFQGWQGKLVMYMDQNQ